MLLTDDLFLNQGNENKIYLHPTDSDKCVKISINKKSRDISRTLKFYKICRKRVEHSTLLPKYFGTVETNLGTGYVVELIRNYDHSISHDLHEYLNTEKDLQKIFHLLNDFHKRYLDELIITSDMDTHNFLVQRTSPTNEQIRIIDNIGTPVKIPIAYYSDFVAYNRAKKYWKRFLQRLHQDYNIDTILDKLAKESFFDV